MHRIPVFALALFLSTGWWGTLVHATAAALGLDAPTATEQPTPPPATESSASIDPLG